MPLRELRDIVMIPPPIGNPLTEGGGISQTIWWHRLPALIAAGLFFVFLADSPGFAQSESRTTTVTERQRPELDPLGVRAGGFIAFPNATITETFNDNIFASENGAVDDFVTNIEPGIVVKSDWGSHEIKLFGNADIAFYADRSNENYEDFNVGGEARLDIVRDFSITAGLTYAGLHESRGSPDDVDGNEPTEFDRLTSTLGIAGKQNRVSLSAEGRLSRLDYDDATTAGVVVDNDDRDRERYDVTLRAGYEIVPEYEGFLRVGLVMTDYDDAVDNVGVNRDSDGIEIVGGARIDITGVLFGDVFAGYISQDYDDPSLQRIEGVTGGVDLTWNVTKLTTLKFGVSRTIEETTQIGASGYFRTDFDAAVDHELLRNLILSGRAGVSLQDYEGIARDDELAAFAISGKYLLNRNLYLSLGYEYTQRESDAAGADYDRNVVMVRARVQL
jgi:hypothetical protein